MNKFKVVVRFVRTNIARWVDESYLKWQKCNSSCCVNNCVASFRHPGYEQKEKKALVFKKVITKSSYYNGSFITITHKTLPHSLFVSSPSWPFISNIFWALTGGGIQSATTYISARKLCTDDVAEPGVSSVSDWLKKLKQWGPIRSTIQIWVALRHQWVWNFCGRSSDLVSWEKQCHRK